MPAAAVAVDTTMQAAAEPAEPAAAEQAVMVATQVALLVLLEQSISAAAVADQVQ
jgi:hypothetical protein